MPLMMDIETLGLHEDRMVVEPIPCETCPASLTGKEEEIFTGLQSGAYKNSRLEQERLSADYIARKLNSWLADYV